MCGIAGFVDPAGEMATLRAMTDAISRRGPDDSGCFLEDGVGLGHRRLSIIDLSPGGHQPMERDGLVITYNGEIYNYREVRRELEQLGDKFKSGSDTEVILAAFRRWGPRCVDRFIGMFAFAVYDRADRALYLVRDRTGVKPLYYYFKRGRLAFGSTLRALRPFLSEKERTTVSNAALGEFFSFGYITNAHSVLEDVHKVPQGHYLKFRDGRVERHCYWDIAFVPDTSWERRSEEDLLDELEALAISAFDYRMVADVPVGVFLSSGVDSSLVSAVLSKNHGQIHTFTIGFDVPGHDESGDARRIAEALGTIHTEASLDADKGFAILNQFSEIYDEPFADSSGIPTSFVSEIAKQAGMKVVLSGDGGDELFGGYSRYTEFARRWHQMGRLGPVGRRAGRFAFGSAAALSNPVKSGKFGRFADLLRHDEFVGFYQNMIRNTSVRQLRELVPAFNEPAAIGHSGEPLSAMSEWDFKRYMPDDILVKVDRATMFHSIEGREPFLDQRLIEFAAKLPNMFKIRNGETKYLLKRLLARYLPEQLFRLPKRGFGVPTADWIEQFYRNSVIEVLATADMPHFDRRQVARLVDRYRMGKPVNHSVLWLLFVFQLWYNKWTADAGQQGDRLRHAG